MPLTHGVSSLSIFVLGVGVGTLGDDACSYACPRPEARIKTGVSRSNNSYGR